MDNYYGTKKFFIITGIELLSFLFFTVLISSIGFIFKASVNIVTVVFSAIIASLIGYLLYKKSFKDKFPIESYVGTIVFNVLIIVFCIAFSGAYLDYNVDSLSYHKVSVGKLAEGWNPVYENVEDFESLYNIHFELEDSTEQNPYLFAKLSVNHYPKALELFGANIYKLTGNIETAKSYNFIIFFGVLFIIFGVLLKKEKISLSFLSLAIVGSTVVSSQLITFYVDGAMYLIISLLIFILIVIHTKDASLNQLEKFILYIMLIPLAINIKFLSFGYAGAYSLAFYLYDFILCLKKKIKWKEFIRFSAIASACVLIGIFVIGLSVYPKNMILKGNPFYPAYGKEKVDIININEPKCLNGPHLKKMITTIFSKTTTDTERCEFKPMFVLTSDEIIHTQRPDVRIGGFGIFFGTVLIICLFAILFLIALFRENKSLFVSFLLVIVTTLLLGAFLNISWWARLFPFPLLLVAISLYLFNRYFYKWCLIPYFLLVIILFIDAMIFFTHSFEGRVHENNTLDVIQEILPDKRCTLYQYNYWMYSMGYNLYDLFGDRVNSIESISYEEAKKDGSHYYTIAFDGVGTLPSTNIFVSCK